VPDHTGATVVLCRRRQCRREGAERVQALVDTPPTGPIAVAWDHAVPQVDEAIAARVRAAAGRLVLLYWATYSPWLHPIERRWRPFRREVTHGALLASLDALLKAAHAGVDRDNQSPDRVLSIIEAYAA
jgi:DDE superfamily endonuclease